MTVGQSKFNSMLSTLLTMHEQGKLPDRAFIEANAEVFEQLWAKGFGCFQITRMDAGSLRSRAMYSGVLTPGGIAAAKALQQ